jgi:hypothetical protein
VSLYFAARLYSAIIPANRTSSRLWVLGFLVSGIAAFVGGTYHGFARTEAVWNITMISIGAGAAFMVGGILAASVKPDSRRWLIRAAIVTFAGFIVQQTGFRRGLDFNHNDLFHVIQIVAQYLFYRAAMLMGEK